MVKGSNDLPLFRGNFKKYSSLYILSVSTPLPAFVDFSDYKNSIQGLS